MPGVNIYDANGNTIVLGQTTKSASIPVTLATDDAVLGVAATGLLKLEDAVAGNGDAGIAALGIRNDSGATALVAGGNGRYGVFAQDANGRAWNAPTGLSVATTITRPANTTPYGAGDVLGGALDLGVLSLVSAERAVIVTAQLEADISAIPTGMTSFLLYLYNVTPPSALADNAVFDLPAGDRASFLGSLNLGSPVDLGSTLYVETNNIQKQVKFAGTHLFGYLVTVGGFTPAANSEVYVLTLHTRQV